MARKKICRAIFPILLALIAFPLQAGGGKEASGLKGMEIVIGNWWGDFDTSTRKAGSDLEEKVIAYRAKIQKDYGFSMREKNIASYEQMPQLAATSIMAGKPAAQVFALQPNWAMMLINRKLLYPVNKSKAVDFNSSRPVNWNREVINSLTFEGNSYAFSIGYGTSRHGTGVFFNKRLFREAGLAPELPYDMVKSGSWTWDAYLDLCKRLTRDINNDGIMDSYAMTQDLSTDILDALVASNGANYIGRDQNGRFTNATNTSEFLQALQFGMRLRSEGVLKPRPEISNWDWFKSEFSDGKVAMMVSPEWMANEIQGMKDDWGFVIFPKGPSAKDYRFSSDENVYAIPSTYTAEEVDKILAAVQLWNTPVDDDETAWKYDMYNQYRDARAVDESLAMFRNPAFASIKNYVYIPGLERGDIAWAMWWWEGDPAQLVESVSQSWDALISDANGIK